MAPTTAATVARGPRCERRADFPQCIRPPRRCLDACKQKDAETRRQWRAACWRLRDYICFRPIYSVPRLGATARVGRCATVCIVHAAPARGCLCMRGARRRNHRRTVSSITFPCCSSISRRPALLSTRPARTTRVRSSSRRSVDYSPEFQARDVVMAEMGSF